MSPEASLGHSRSYKSGRFRVTRSWLKVNDPKTEFIRLFGGGNTIFRLVVYDYLAKIIRSLNSVLSNKRSYFFSKWSYFHIILFTNDRSSDLTSNRNRLSTLALFDFMLNDLHYEFKIWTHETFFDKNSRSFYLYKTNTTCDMSKLS